jgi:multidrug efflux pump subunit AcrB
MSDRVVSVTERSLTTTVDNIEHIESQSLYGVAVVKVFLQPTANIQRGIAQITAISQTQLRQLPSGTTPPLILAYSASSVPVLQLALSGQNLAEQELNDYGLNFIRTQLITVPGASVPYPYGGKQRQVQVDLNTTALQSKGLSALDVVNAISLQNLILPTGTSKIGSREYDVSIPNAAPQTIADLNRIPIKTIGSTTIYMKDVAWVRDGFPPQTNIVRVNGQRSVLLTIQKAGDASTLDVIAGIKALLPQIAATVPPQLKITPLADQSDFCSWCYQRGRQGNADCRLPDGFHDPYFSRQLAKHLDHRDVHPAGDPDLHHYVQCDWRNHQHHDARGTGFGGWHSGRRRHGRGREH